MSTSDVKIIRRSGQHSVSFSQDTQFGSNDKKVFKIHSSSEGTFVCGRKFEFHFVILSSATKTAIKVREAYSRKIEDKNDLEQLAAWATISMTNCDIIICDLDSNGDFIISLKVKPDLLFGTIKWDPIPASCSSLRSDMALDRMESLGIDRIRYIRLQFKNPTSNRFLIIPEIEAILRTHEYQEDLDAIEACIRSWPPEKAKSFELYVQNLANGASTMLDGFDLCLMALDRGFTRDECRMISRRFRLRGRIRGES